MKKKLKLTKLTVANLERIKGGIDHCVCNIYLNDNANNKLHLTTSVCYDPCVD